MSSDLPSASGASKAQTCLPAKLYFRIGEVAGLVGVEPHVLRYWEREFRSIRPQKSTKGQRIYSRKDVENLLRVRDLLYRDGFTIAGAKKRMKRGAEAELVPAPDTEPELGDLDGDADGDEEPASGPHVFVGTRHGIGVREKLMALRAEVESFVDELGRADGELRRDAAVRAERRR